MDGWMDGWMDVREWKQARMTVSSKTIIDSDDINDNREKSDNSGTEYGRFLAK
jgi:hypothetical protein